MLAAAAVLAAGIGARTSMLSDSAGGSWQSAVRQEVKKSAAAVEDIRFVYAEEAPVAYRVVRARIRAEELRREADRTTGDARAATAVEALLEESLAEALGSSSELASQERYALDSGGVDVAKRLADNRQEHPELVAVNPDVPQRQGDEAAEHARLEVAATIPVAVAFLFGAVAQAFPRRRRLMVIVGSAFLLLALAAAIALEVRFS